MTFLNFLLKLLARLFAQPEPIPTPMPETTPQPVTPPPSPVSEPPALLWDTPVDARHSVRVVCDRAGLSVKDKNDLCATVGGESGWMSYYVDGPKKGQPVKRENLRNGVVWSTDWGICQWNDHYHGTEITPQEALDNPEKAVRLMCDYWKLGEAHKEEWIAYKNGSYKKYL